VSNHPVPSYKATFRASVNNLLAWNRTKGSLGLKLNLTYVSAGLPPIFYGGLRLIGMELLYG